MLTALDDYLAHQIPETFDHVATSDRNFFDRYYFNAYSLDGEVFLTCGMGWQTRSAPGRRWRTTVLQGRGENLSAWLDCGRLRLDDAETRANQTRPICR